MKFVIIKTINNNVVLAKDPFSKEEVILMSKGIAFGKKQGDYVEDDGAQRQIYKLWPDTKQINDISYDRTILQSTVREICEKAGLSMGIKFEDIFQPLLDHITFSIDRLSFNLPMDDPFQNETYVLYSSEYELAKDAVDMLESRLGISLGKSEIGFIALHLNAGRRKRPISTSLNHVRLYNKVANLIINELGENEDKEFELKVFLMSFASILQQCESNNQIKMPWKNSVLEKADKSYSMALKVSEITKNELKLELSDDALGFITSDIEKLRQIFK